MHSTYKTNRYRFPLLEFVGVTPTGMTFSAGIAYLEGERVKNIRDLALMNALKIVFSECTNLLCRFHIEKNVKAKCKSLIGQKNSWEYIMNSWGTLFPEHLQKFQVACSPWPMFVDYVCETWIVPHKEKFITTWTNKVMHLGNTTTNRVLHNSLGDLCSVWDAMNNKITLQHTQIKASFETSTHVVGHVYKKSLYKRLLGMVLRYALNEIVYEFECVRYFRNNPSSCGCVLRTTLGLPCACELKRYDGGSIPLNAGLCEAEVSIKEEMDRIYKRFEELDVCGKVSFKSKLREFAYPDENSMCPPLSKVNTKGALKKLMKRSQRSTKRVQNNNTSVICTASSSEPLKPTSMIPMLDQFVPFIQGFIEDVVDVKADGNCGYWSVAALLGKGEESWALMCNELIKELDKWLQDYIKLFGGMKRFEQLRLSLHVDGLSKVSVDKWMDITEMRYVIASRYNVILVLLSRQQSFTFFPLKIQPPPDSSTHCMVCVGLSQRSLSLTACGIVVVKQFISLGKTVANYIRNKIHFQCMQLKDDMDVHTMLMSNDQFSCVGPIELLCTVGRTADEILNLLERTMTPTYDTILYYNGRWNMPRQNNFVGYAFIGKNPQKFDIPKGCTIDELKDSIKQVAPKGNPPHGIHESQLVRRLFFRQHDHLESSDKVLKFEIIELKSDNDVLKVLVESNYWKQFVPIEILALFSKPVMENEDEVVTSL
ncbi:hypothetical protein HKD37_14G040311 [Glycine soja]